jgi:putative SOS response-associated peptidase YedK
MQEIARRARARLAELAHPEQLRIKFEGDVFPGDVVACGTPSGVELMRWGFSMGQEGIPPFQGDGAPATSRPKLLFNARSETAMSKPVFRGPMHRGRCLVPASAYYEWGAPPAGRGGHRQRYRFGLGHTLYLAACYRTEQSSELPVFAILTQAAGSQAAVVHERMPVIIPQALCPAWLKTGPEAMRSALSDLAGVPV